MARGYRGAGSRPSLRTGGGGKSSSSKSNGGSKPKGQVGSGKVVQYSIKNPKGATTYVGSTNNPTRRAGEHRDSGKLGTGDKLVVETKAISRRSAEKVEATKLGSHRRSQGSNPKHNVTNDGKFH